MKTIVKVILGIAIPVLLAGSICGVYYGIKYHNVKNEEVKEDSGVVNIVNELRKDIADLEKEKSGLNAQIAGLNAQIEALNLANADSKATIETLQGQISTLNSQISNLNVQIQYYQELLKAYENINKLTVSLKVNDEVYAVQLVETGNKIDKNKIVEPKIAGYDFLGWTLESSEELIDLDTFEVTENVTLVAKLQEAWRTIYSTPTLVLQNNTSQLASSNIAIPGIQNGDKMRVTFSNLSLHFGMATRAVPGDIYYSYCFKNGEYVWEESGTEYAEIVVKNGTTKQITYEDEIAGNSTISLSINCDKDGVLTINHKIEGVNNASIYSLSLEKVEVIR